VFAAAMPPVPVILAVMGFGVIVAIIGHVTKFRGLVLTGLLLVFLATAGMLVGGFVSYHDDPNSDPRQERNYQEPAF
jgi:hypothetical protein